MKSAPLLLLTSAALILWLGQPAGADAPPRYRLTVLPLTFQNFDQFNYAPIAGGGINNAGQIVGQITARSGRLKNLRVAIWQKRHPTKFLDTTPVARDIKEEDPSNRDYTFATAINARGEAVGDNYLTFSGAYSGTVSRAYVWANSRMEEIRDFPFECDGFVCGINDHGWVVGDYSYNKQMPTSDDPPPPPIAAGTHAFLFRGGHVMPLWQGIARGINNQWQIVGTQSAGGYDRSRDKGILWRNGHITRLKMQPVAINGRGEIAGNVPLTEDTGRACVWRRGRVTLLSKQISHAFALNSRGAVVGERDDPASSHPARAALWRRCRAYDLNRCVGLPANWVLQSATGINDKGWIIGNGSIYKTPKDKQPAAYFSFLLTPR